jgi:hypothetical protein
VSVGESLEVPLDVDTKDYCREIERYLCQKNDGHLIRVVGPSFDLVARWAAVGVPLKVAFAGIDRCVDRYYKKGPRRRPVRIDFCEADVLDVFDEWRRATGVAASERALPQAARGASLPVHLERVLTKLTNARALGLLDDRADAIIDRVSHELDQARRFPGGIRGDQRHALLSRLASADVDLAALASASLDDATRTRLAIRADEDLSAFRVTMAPDAFERARARAVERLVREHLRLPTITFA